MPQNSNWEHKCSRIINALLKKDKEIRLDLDSSRMSAVFGNEGVALLIYYGLEDVSEAEPYSISLGDDTDARENRRLRDWHASFFKSVARSKNIWCTWFTGVVVKFVECPQPNHWLVNATVVKKSNHSSTRSFVNFFTRFTKLQEQHRDGATRALESPNRPWGTR